MYRNFIQKHQDLLLAIVAILGLVYLASKVISLDGAGGQDFKVIWIAGKNWAAAQNPYGASFTAKYLDAFGVGQNDLWLYPPYWYPIAVPLSLLPFSVANEVWKIANAALLIGAIHLIARSLADTAGKRYRTIFLAGLAFACLLQATALALFVGQTSFLVFFGLAAVIFGILKGRPLLLICGLVILALKPQIGVVVFAAIAAHRHYRWVLFPAGAICLLATAPIAISGNYNASIVGFLANLPQQSAIPGNAPHYLTGLINLFDYIVPHSLSSELALIFTAVGCATLVFNNLSINRTINFDDAQHKTACLAVLVASTFFLVPLHGYDLISITSMLMMTLAAPLAGRWLVISGLLLCFRPGNLADALAGAHSDYSDILETHFYSAGLCLLFVGAMIAILNTRGATLGAQTSVTRAAEMPSHPSNIAE